MSNLENLKSLGKVRIGLFLSIFVLLVSLAVILFSYFAFAADDVNNQDAYDPNVASPQDSFNDYENKSDMDVYVQNPEKEALEDAVVNGTEQDVQSLTDQNSVSKVSNEDIK